MHTRCVVVLGYKCIVKRSLAVFLALCLCAIPSLAAETTDIVPPGNWGAVESLKQGAEISVRMTFGDRLDGRFVSLDAESINFAADEKDMTYPRSDVAEVWEVRVPDRKRNGVLIGLGVGIAGGITGMAAIAKAKTNGSVYWGEDTGAYLVAGALVGGGIGALIGVVVDSAIKGDKLLYRAK